MRQFAINLFLLFHLFVVTLWSLPFSSPLAASVREAVRPYMLWSGLFQAWDTFSPIPQTVNARVQGVVITHDGHIHVWDFPRMEQLSFLQRYQKERYRKFAENLPLGQNAAAWPDVAKQLARRYRDPANQPEIVMLVQFRSAISPQSKGPNPERGQSFFEYHVRAEDLQ